MEFAGIAMAALMVAGFVMGVIQQVKREVMKERAKERRIGSTRNIPAGWRDMRRDKS